MKTQPDETTLTLWMDGELEGDELQHVEAWAQQHPEILAERDAILAMNASIKQHVPDSIEPPYPEFFNQHILRHIDDEVVVPAAVAAPRKSSFWQWLAMPIAAGAMAVCFYLGTQVSETPANQGLTIPPMASIPTVYTPDGDVSADMFKSNDATVIVLEGLEDIPDDLDMVGEPSRSHGRAGAVMVSTEITF